MTWYLIMGAFYAVIFLVIGFVIGVDYVTIGQEMTEDEYEELKASDKAVLKIGKWVIEILD